jgi:hypothetical protein
MDLTLDYPHNGYRDDEFAGAYGRIASQNEGTEPPSRSMDSSIKLAQLSKFIVGWGRERDVDVARLPAHRDDIGGRRLNGFEPDVARGRDRCIEVPTADHRVGGHRH